MTKEKKSPSLMKKGQNLAKFSLELITYIQNNHEKVLFVSDEAYEKRMMTCRSCDQYQEVENQCAECGCYIPAKAKIVLDSCPLGKWKVETDDWNKKFDNIIEDSSNIKNIIDKFDGENS